MPNRTYSPNDPAFIIGAVGEVNVFIDIFPVVDFNDEIAQAIFELTLETEVVTVQEIKEAYWNIGDFSWQNAFL